MSIDSIILILSISVSCALSSNEANRDSKARARKKSQDCDCKSQSTRGKISVNEERTKCSQKKSQLMQMTRISSLINCICEGSRSQFFEQLRMRFI